ncbi:MAG: hypothetical protein ACHQ16_02165, partial [Candidatus Lutacidiplasmatales archaeon]
FAIEAAHSPGALRAPAQTGHLGVLAPGVLPPAGSLSAGTRAAPVAGALSGNTYLNTPCSTTTTVTNVNGTNSTLLAGLSSYYLLYNASGGAFCNTQSVSAAFFQHGFTESARSTDSGATWTPNWIPQNTSWTNTLSPLNGSVPGMFLPISGLAQPAYASPSVTSANDGTTFLATQFMPGCWLSNTCTTNGTDLNPSGIAIARSTDGGASWANTTDLAQAQFFHWVTPVGACIGVLSAGFYNYFIPYSPTVVVNPVSDVAIATWEMFELHFIQNSTACGGVVFGQVQESTSANGGVSWSKPVNLSGSEGYNPQVAIGPSPKYVDTILYMDISNATQDSTTGAFIGNWFTTTSSNNGTTWSTPATTSATGNVNTLWGGSSGPDAFAITDQPYPLLHPTRPGFTIDATPSSPHAGSEYVVWADNRTPSNAYQNFPSIAFQEHTSGGVGWTGTSYLTPATRAVTYFEPTVSVAPSGTIWVTFYGETKSGGSAGDLNMYAVYSTNGGSVWSTVAPITTANSVLPNTLSTIGDYTGATATNAGTFVTWMDCRANDCTGAFNTSAMVSLVEPVSLTTAPTNVTVTVTTNGIAQPILLPGGIPLAVGTSHTVTAPNWLPSTNTTVGSFHNFTGIVNSTTAVTTFTYNGGGSLVVNFVYVPASFLAGFFSPNTTFDKLTVDGANVPLISYNATALRYNYSVASGRSYYLNASASNLYVPLTNQVVGTTPSQTTTFDVNLAKTHGWLRGVVSPFNATVLVDGQAIAVDTSNGVYNVTEFWGSYWLNASGFGVTTYSNFVTVAPVAATTDNIVLSGGWIRGALSGTYPGVALTLDGVAISGLTGATFNQSTLGGKHIIGATATGYNTSLINVSVIPGHTTVVAVNLTNQGTVIGSVGPTAALSVATLSVINLSKSGGGPERINAATGAFKVNVTGDAYWTVTVKATGYTSFTTNVLVKPGQDTAPVIVQLVATTPKTNCTTTNTCQNTTPPPTTSSGISLALVGGIIVVVVLVAAVAAVLLMRRRGGGGAAAPPEGAAAAPETPTDGSETYGGGSYGGPPAQ